MKPKARRALGVLIAVLALCPSFAMAQVASRPGYSVGTAGSACDGTNILYGWPDANGNILKCVSNLWQVQGITGTAGGSNTQVQYNSGGALVGDSGLTYSNPNLTIGYGSLYIGTSAATIGTLLLGGMNGLSYPSAETNCIGCSIAVGPSALANVPAMPAGSSLYGNIAIGSQVMSSASMTTAAINNIGIGYQVLSATTNGSNNTAIGYQAGKAVASTTASTAIGYQALMKNAVGSGNVAVGATALSLDTSGSFETAIGGAALYNSSGGSYNTAVGNNAMVYNGVSGQGNRNTGIGALALYYNGTASGVNNTAIGFQAGKGSGATASFANSVFVGANTGLSMTSGSSNVVIGSSVASTTLATGSYNILIGNDATSDTYSSSTNYAVGLGYGNKPGSGDIAIGYQALQTNAGDGLGNIAIGSQTLSAALTSLGTSNVAIGSQALLANTSGYTNTAVGALAMKGNTTAQGNTAVGYESMIFNTTGTFNTAVGYAALPQSNTGANTAVGVQALQTTTGANNTGVGYRALLRNAGGLASSALGYGALANYTTGSSNVGVGYFAGGGQNPATGSNSIFVGAGSGYNMTTGSHEVVLGSYAANVLTTGSNNVVIGSSVASTTLTTGGNNILIGTDSQVDTPTATTNNFLNIGNLIYGTSIGTAASQGNVGIGTTAPVSKLAVIGDFTVGTSPTSPGVYLQTIAAQAGGSTAGDIVGMNPLETAFSPLEFTTSSWAIPTMYMDTSGNVGIGTGLPRSMLHVYNGEVQIGSSGASCTANNAGALRYSSSSFYVCNGSTWSAPSAGAAGSNGQVQWNNSGALGASSNLYWDDTNIRLGIGTSTVNNAIGLEGSAGRTIAVEAASSGAGAGLALRAGNAQSGSTNQNGGNLTLIGGVGTGNGSGGGQIIFQTTTNGASGTTYESFSTRMSISGNNGGVQINTAFSPPTDILTVGGNIDIYSNPGSGGIGGLNFRGLNASGTQINFAGIGGGITSKVAGAENGYMNFAVYEAGTNTAAMQINDVGGVAIGNSYIAALGTSSAPANGLIVQGNVGIGTASPAYPLDVQGAWNPGQVTIGSATQAGRIGFRRGTDGLADAYLGYASATDGTTLQLQNLSGAGLVSFGVNVGGTETNVLNVVGGSNGYVGIGTISPNATLQVQGNITGVGGLISVHDSSDNERISLLQTSGIGVLRAFNSGSMNLYLQAGGNSYFNGGNVGIGTTTPGAILQVRVATDANLRVQSNSGTTTIASYNDAGSALEAVNIYGNGLHLNPSAGYNVYIVENGGLVGIGTTAPQSMLQVNGGEVQIGSSGASCTANNAGALRYFSSSFYVCNGSTWSAPSSGAAGSSGQVQWNNSGALAGSANLVWDNTNGRLGIGTTVPLNKLDVSGGSVIGAGYIGTTTAPTNGLIVQGSVGIGTQNPLYTVDIEGSAPTVNFGATSNSRNLTFTPSGGSIDTPNASMYLNRSNANSVYLVFGGGNVGVGTNVPLNKLDVSGGSVIGAGYIGTTTAPSNGLIVQGNVGIGTQSPLFTLQVVGTGVNSSDSGTGGLALSDAVNPLKKLYMGYDRAVGTNGVGFIQAAYTGQAYTPLFLNAHGGKVVVNNSSAPVSTFEVYGNASIGTYAGTNAAPTNGLIVSGNVGIGTITPLNALDISGGSVIGAGYIGTTTAPSNGLIVQGNVGIGTTAPAQLLEAYGTSGNIFIRTTNTATGQDVGFSINPKGTSAHEWRLTASDPTRGSTGASFTITDATASSNRLVIDTSGNVGIGTVAPGASLDVVGNIRGYDFFPTGANFPNLGGSATLVCVTYQATYTGYYTMGYCTGSDLRLKENIQDTTPEMGLAAIDKLRTVTFKWKDVELDKTDGPQIGMVAQDVQKIFPQFVTKNGPATVKLADGTQQTIPDTLTLNYAKLVVPLIKAVQELHAFGLGQADDVRSLRDEVHTLKAANDNLRNTIDVIRASADADHRELEELKKQLHTR